ncbi:MAG: urate hydroxylase PuuD [Rhodospirillales bacterium]
MFEATVILDWAEFAARWLHVITAIAWIGSSFYFIALDLGLRKVADMPPGVHGEEWQVHGGGFYHIRKYMVAPAALPEHLTWFKWESYWTWMSGFILLCLVYYIGADLFLIDPEVLDLPVWGAIAISLGVIVGGWFGYDLICKSRLGQNPTMLMLVLYAIVVVLAWALTQVFSGRAALLHLGAVTATIMSANVFITIIPNQKIVVEDLKAGRQPDPEYGRIAKLRSTHNNYLTLPVIFLMLSNHYPLAFAGEYNWIIASLVFLMGVTIRHYFNSHHARKGNPLWTIPATIALFAAIIVLSLLPFWMGDEPAETTEAPMTPAMLELAATEGFEDVVITVQSRCAMCHATWPGWDGIAVAPKNVRLETEADVLRHARAIMLQSGITRAMPPANVSFMEPAERKLIRDWYVRAGAPL